MPNVRDSKHH